MDKELRVIDIPHEVVISESLMEFEKSKLKSKQLNKIKKPIEKGAAFHEKKDKNKKVNLGGPGKRTPRKSKPRNRAVEAKIADKIRGE